MTVRVEVICIGTELVTGKVNTHTSYLGPKLAEIGLSIAREHTIPDVAAVMKEAFREAYRRSDVVISAGGLGPTFDDITRDEWSRVLNRPLKIDPALIRDIEEKFRSRRLAMPPANRRQAQVLKGADVIPNDFGTAPGQYLAAGKKVLVLLPGPARELYPMVETFVLPRLREAFSTRHSATRAFFLVGVPESSVDAKIRPFVRRYPRLNGCRVVHGILASGSIITVKFTVEGRDERVVRRTAETLAARLKPLLGRHVFGEDHATLEGAVGRLLTERGETLALAESCTGGLVSKMITDRSGASTYFLEGVVTYSNASKKRRLSVSPRSLREAGAVSERVAREMAEGVRRRTGADYGVSITGVAGPDGGTPEKPVGLVFIACAGPRGTVAKEFRFNGDRAWIRHRSAVMALALLRESLVKRRTPPRPARR